MSKTYRLNPETFEEAQERNHLKRKKKEEHERRIRSHPFNHIVTDDCDEYLNDESND